jgi:hypothetical protein
MSNFFSIKPGPSFMYNNGVYYFPSSGDVPNVDNLLWKVYGDNDDSEPIHSAVEQPTAYMPTNQDEIDNSPEEEEAPVQDNDPEEEEVLVEDDNDDAEEEVPVQDVAEEEEVPVEDVAEEAKVEDDGAEEEVPVQDDAVSVEDVAEEMPVHKFNETTAVMSTAEEALSEVDTEVIAEDVAHDSIPLCHKVPPGAEGYVIRPLSAIRWIAPALFSPSTKPHLRYALFLAISDVGMDAASDDSWKQVYAGTDNMEPALQSHYLGDDKSYVSRSGKCVPLKELKRQWKRLQDDTSSLANFMFRYSIALILNSSLYITDSALRPLIDPQQFRLGVLLCRLSFNYCPPSIGDVVEKCACNVASYASLSMVYHTSPTLFPTAIGTRQSFSRRLNDMIVLLVQVNEERPHIAKIPNGVKNTNDTGVPSIEKDEEWESRVEEVKAGRVTVPAGFRTCLRIVTPGGVPNYLTREGEWTGEPSSDNLALPIVADLQDNDSDPLTQFRLRLEDRIGPLFLTTKFDTYSGDDANARMIINHASIGLVRDVQDWDQLLEQVSGHILRQSHM